MDEYNCTLPFATFIANRANGLSFTILYGRSLLHRFPSYWECPARPAASSITLLTALLISFKWNKLNRSCFRNRIENCRFQQRIPEKWWNYRPLKKGFIHSSSQMGFTILTTEIPILVYTVRKHLRSDLDACHTLHPGVMAGKDYDNVSSDHFPICPKLNSLQPIRRFPLYQKIDIRTVKNKLRSCFLFPRQSVQHCSHRTLMWWMWDEFDVAYTFDWILDPVRAWILAEEVGWLRWKSKVSVRSPDRIVATSVWGSE